MNQRFKVIDFPNFSDERGDLVPFELNDDFPFVVKRVYLVTAKDGAIRGGHAHKVESEVFVAAQGTIKALVNDGSGDKVIELDAQNKALLVETNCWHEFYDFSDDAVLLCFSSTHYLPGEENYIMDKDEFLNSKSEQPLTETPDLWLKENGVLKRSIRCKNYVEAVALINQIKTLAESANHHPDVTLYNFNHLRIELQTHDLGAITPKDIALALAINNIL